MAFIKNPNNNSVIYNSPTWDEVVLQETWKVDSSVSGPESNTTAHSSGTGETLRTLTDFTIPIGKWERMYLKYNIHFTQHTTGRSKFKIDTPDSSTTRSVVWTGVYPDSTEVHTLNQSADPTLAVDIAGTHGLITLDVIFENDGTAGEFLFQFAQTANNVNPVKILAGSYVSVKKY